MFNDENQEDVTLQNNVNSEGEATVQEENTDTEPDWKAESKKWEAIAKRNAKKVEKGVEVAEAPRATREFDEELIQITYKNHLAGIGLTDSSIQDEAIALSKKMGVSIAKIQDDSAIMEVLKTKQKQAVAQKAVAGGTGGAAVVRNDTNRIVAKIAQGQAVKEDDISGEQALEMLGFRR